MSKRKFLDPNWKIPCSEPGCDKLAAVDRCPWGDLAYCTEHDDKMNKDLDDYMQTNPPDGNNPFGTF